MGDWSIERVGDNWQVMWRGQPFGSPRSSRQEAQDAVSTWQVRYPGESAGCLLRTVAHKCRKRSGLWGWHRKDGTKGTLFASSMKAAKEALRHLLQRQRLPSDLVLEPPK